VLSLALIDLHTLDFPISLGKRRAIIACVSLARGDPSSLCTALILSRDARRCPDRARPVTAQGGVEDDPMILEELERIAAARGPERARRPPVIRNRRSGGDIGRDILPGEEPDRDTQVVPKHREDTTPVIVERRSERVGLTRPHTATLVARLQCRTVRAANDSASDTQLSDVARGQLTPSVRMNRGLVIRIVVHAFDDVDFAGGRPVRPVCPERRPYRATRGHVNAIHDNEPAREAELCLNANGIAVAGNLRRGVNAHDSISSLIDRGQVAGLRRRLVDKVHDPIRRITTGEEIPSGEKAVARIRLHQIEIGLRGRARSRTRSGRTGRRRRGRP